MTLEEFRSFLKLLSYAVKSPGEFLPSQSLLAANAAQRVAEIRAALGEFGRTLVEVQRGKGYRLSVHPELIHYDKQALLLHPSADVKEIVRALPECDSASNGTPGGPA